MLQENFTFHFFEVFGTVEVTSSSLANKGTCSVAEMMFELSKRLAEFAELRGWDKYHSPRNLLLALVGEVGELSEISQWKGEVAKGLPNWSCDDKEQLEEDLSDVLLYLMHVADVYGLDLGQADLTKIIENA
ncbi:hypothetical protein RJT34_02709 [Clitoria ternatea]|uniref:dCTP pyrophosphatase 1 n=1 Tax=Clitoria ternatea TaxID=43366 RepID=A0AAN9KIE3_CLITE